MTGSWQEWRFIPNVVRGLPRGRTLHSRSRYPCKSASSPICPAKTTQSKRIRDPERIRPLAHQRKVPKCFQLVKEHVLSGWNSSMPIYVIIVILHVECTQSRRVVSHVHGAQMADETHEEIVKELDYALCHGFDASMHNWRCTKRAPSS